MSEQFGENTQSNGENENPSNEENQEQSPEVETPKSDGKDPKDSPSEKGNQEASNLHYEAGKPVSYEFSELIGSGTVKAEDIGRLVTADEMLDRAMREKDALRDTETPPAENNWLNQFDLFGEQQIDSLEKVANMGLTDAEASLLVLLAARLNHIAETSPRH